MNPPIPINPVTTAAIPIVDGQGKPVADSQSRGVVADASAPHPDFVALLRSFDRNGNGAFDEEEAEHFGSVLVYASFIARSKEPEILDICKSASEPIYSENGKLRPLVLKQVESRNKERAHAMVQKYFGNDIAKNVFPNGIAQVTDDHLARVFQYARDRAQDCASGKAFEK